MKKLHRYSWFVLVSVLLIIIFFIAFYTSEKLSGFVETLQNVAFVTSELPDWLLYVFGILVFTHVFKIISVFYGIIKKYHIGYLGMFIVLTSCQELNGCFTYPSPKDWTETCEFFSSPVHARYSVSFQAYLNDWPPTFTRLADVEVNCKVIRERRASQPWAPDSCYWSRELVATFNGTTDSTGTFTFNFEIDFDSESDYFIIEGSFEKQGYNRGLFSDDQRWYYYNDEFVKCTVNYLPFRRVDLRYGLTPIDISP